MKYSTIALIAFSGLAVAQSNLPECSQKCIADSVAANTKCGASDIACQCETANKAAIQGGATTCVIAACGADKALDVLTAANAACSALGSGSSSAAAATSSAAAETSSAAAETSSAAGYVTSSAAAATSSAAAVTSTKSIVTSASAAPTPSANGTKSATPTPTPTQFPGTAAQVAVSFGSVFAMGMAVLAAF